MEKSKWKDIEVSSLQEFNAETHRLTIESIQEATLELLRKKSLKEIKVKEIVEKAGVSRSAFYKNYDSKDEVMQSIVHDSFRDLSGKLKKKKGKSENEVIPVIRELVENCGKLSLLYNGDAWQGDTLLQCMNLYMKDFMAESLQYEDEYQVQFWIGGTYNVIQYWIDTGMHESSEELAEKILKLHMNK